MQTISERDAAALLEVVGELERLEGPLAFPPRFLALLAPLVGSPGATYSVLDRRNARGVFLSGWYEGEEFVEVGHTEGARWYQRLRRRAHHGQWGGAARGATGSLLVRG